MRYIRTFTSGSTNCDDEINRFLKEKQAKLISVNKRYFEDHYEDGRRCNSWFDVTIIYKIKKPKPEPAKFIQGNECIHCQFVSDKELFICPQCGRRK